MAARETLGAEPDTVGCAVASHRLGHVVGAGGLEPAGACEKRGHQQFVRAQDGEQRARKPAGPATACRQAAIVAPGA